MKKKLSTAMAAAMAFGAVVPTFANEVETLAENSPVDVALAEGNKVEVKTYGDTFDTHFTADKKDDTVKKGLTILDVISKEEGKESYLVARKKTIADIKAEGVTGTDKELQAALAKQIAQAKLDLEETIADVKHKLTLSFVNDKGETKKLYTIDKKASGEVQAENNGGESNKYKLVLIHNNKGENTTSEFTNIKVEEKETEKPVEVKTATIDLVDPEFTGAGHYKELSKYAYELKAAKNITVETKEVNPATLEVKVYKKDEKKTHVATLTIVGMDRFDAKQFMDVPVDGDFVGHWAQDAIVEAMLNGQVDLSNAYRPQGSITRAEFAKIACTVFRIDVVKGQDEPFHDVDNGMWYQDYVAALYNTKVGGVSVVQGDGQNFRPNDTITRQEVAVIVAKLTKNAALETTIDVNGSKVDRDVVTNFGDDKDIATWADESVEYLNEVAKYENSKGELKPISEGDEGKFNPRQSITRAESLVMVQRAATAIIPMTPVDPAQ